MEDDDDMLTIWACLFANFQDPELRLEPNKIYVHLLSEKQPLDAKLLHHIAMVLPETQRVVGGPYANTIGLSLAATEQLANALTVAENTALLSMHNLGRLGCLLGRPPIMPFS